MKVDSQKSVKFSGSLAATSKDLQEKSNFICTGSVAFAAGAIAGVATFAVGACMCVPGPGWVMAAIIAAVVVAALIFPAANARVPQQHVHGFLPQRRSIPN